MANEAKSDWTAGDPIDGIASLQVADKIARMRGDRRFTAGDRLAESLAKNSAMSVTLMLLKKGAILKEHQARATVALAIVTGAIRLNGVTFGAGTIAMIGAEVPHLVEALEESAMVLTAALN